MAGRLLLRAARRQRPAPRRAEGDGRRPARRDRRGRGQRHPDRPRPRRRAHRGQARSRQQPVPHPGRGHGQHPRRRWRPTSSPSRRRSSCWPRPRAAASSATDPATGLPVYAKSGRFGPYVQLGDYDDDGEIKPKMASLFKTMTLDHVSLDDALELLSLPRVVGVDPADGAEITAAQRPVRAVRPEGRRRRQEGQPQPRPTRSSCSPSRLDRRAGDLRPAQAAPGPGGQAAAAPARRRPGQRQADGDQGRPLRALRHRRRDQRLAAQGRRRRDHHRRAGVRAAGRPARARSGRRRRPARPRRSRPRRRRRRPPRRPRPRRRRPRRRRAKTAARPGER